MILLFLSNIVGVNNDNDNFEVQEKNTDTSRVKKMNCHTLEVQQKNTDSSNIIKVNCDTSGVRQKNINLCTSTESIIKPLCNNVSFIIIFIV